jgi:hypothetical protein
MFVKLLLEQKQIQDLLKSKIQLIVIIVLVGKKDGIF